MMSWLIDLVLIPGILLGVSSGLESSLGHTQQHSGFLAPRNSLSNSGLIDRGARASLAVETDHGQPSNRVVQIVEGGHKQNDEIRIRVDAEESDEVQRPGVDLNGRTEVDEHRPDPSEQCAICLLELGVIAAPRQVIKLLACSHQYHHHCVNEWFHRAKNCPICRAKVDDQNKVVDLHNCQPILMADDFRSTQDNPASEPEHAGDFSMWRDGIRQPVFRSNVRSTPDHSPPDHLEGGDSTSSDSSDIEFPETRNQMISLDEHRQALEFENLKIITLCQIFSCSMTLLALLVGLVILLIRFRR